MADRFKYSEVRQKIIDAIRTDLIGPRDKEEVLEENPRQIDKGDSNPKVYLIEKTQNNVWTCKQSCDIVCVGAEPKIKKGVIINGNTKYTCGKRAT